jgi:AraC-like DNA-binding protein
MTQGERLFPRPTARWRWVHRFASARSEEVRRPAHERWMPRHQHAHGYREIMAVIGGRHAYGVGGRAYRADPGSVFLFDRGEAHDATYSPHQPDCRDLWFHLSAPHQAVVNEILCRGGKIQNFDPGARSEGHPYPFRLRSVVSGAFVECVTESWDRCSRGDASRAAVAQLQASVAALLLHTEQRLLAPAAGDAETSAQRGIVEHIAEHVRRHAGEDLSLENLARMAGYAPTYFHRLFHRHTGRRLHAFVNSVRLEKARALLGSGRTVQAVADDLGFGTAAYFSRFFRHATGHPPSRWKGRAR